MARRRIALAGCLQGEGPWIRATGDEDVAAIGPLNDGERIVMQVDSPADEFHCVVGLNPIILEPDQKYRFVKIAPEGVPRSRTCVEVRFRCPESVQH